MAEKLAIIMSGGGTKSSYGVGVILALVKKYKITEPYLLICGSGSAGTGSYYITKQYSSILNIWTRLVCSKNFVNRKRFWRIIDIDYLIDVIFRKQDPLNEKMIYSSKTRYLIPALNKETGRIDYFDNKNKTNIFESMRATKAMPIAYKINPKVKVGNSEYCDSFVSSEAKMHIKKAIELGAQKILIINNDFDFKKGLSDLFFSVWMFFQRFKNEYYAMEKKLSTFTIPKNIKLYTISPNKMLTITTLNNSPALLQKTIERGYNDTMQDQKLKSFLN